VVAGLTKIANGSSFSHEAPLMPTRNVNLTEELDHFITSKVASGRYENASEVVRASLRALEREEQEHEAGLDALRAALVEGEQSGIVPDGVLERVLTRLRERASR
jgi:antitoxin ParD1/3/4